MLQSVPLPPISDGGACGLVGGLLVDGDKVLGLLSRVSLSRGSLGQGSIGYRCSGGWQQVCGGCLQSLGLGGWVGEWGILHLVSA